MIGSFSHGSQSSNKSTSSNQPGYALTSGKVSSLLLVKMKSPTLSTVLESTNNQEDKSSIASFSRGLLRSLARQSAGMETKSIRTSTYNPESEEVSEADPTSTSLYSQPFMMLLPSAGEVPEDQAGKDVRELSVQVALKKWSEARGLEGENPVTVVEMKRWEVGELAEKVEAGEGFAEEVRRAAGQV